MQSIKTINGKTEIWFINFFILYFIYKCNIELGETLLAEKNREELLELPHHEEFQNMIESMNMKNNSEKNEL